MAEEQSTGTMEVTEQEALDLVRGMGNRPPIEFDADEIVRGEEYDPDIPTEEPRPDAQAAAAPPPATPQVDEATSQRLAALEAENRRLRDEENKRREEDFQRLLETKTPEEQVQMLKEHYAERDRAAEIERLRRDMATEFPVASAFAGPVFERLSLEIESASDLRGVLEHLESQYGPIVDAMVEKRLNEQVAATRAQEQQTWNPSAITGIQPKPPASTTPQLNAMQRYAASVENVEKSTDLRVDDVAAMVRQGDIARREARKR